MVKEKLVSSPKRFQWRVPKDSVGTVRSDLLLKKKLPGLSNRILTDLFSQKCVHINGRTVVKGFKASPGDHLEIKIPGPLSPFSIPGQVPKPSVLFEDQAFLVIEKPGLVPTHPLSPFETGTLANALVCYWPQIVRTGDKPLEPGLVHRLDSGTSGLLVAALEQGIWLQLKKDLVAKKWEKIYWALVEGAVQNPTTISFPLAHDPTDKRKMKVVRNSGDRRRGRVYQAITRIRPMKAFSDHTLVEVQLITGVTHQIRAHLSFQGHPIAGDILYDSKTSDQLGLPLGRFFLHAHRLSLPHPVTRKQITCSSGLPEDLQRVLSLLV